jgi:hypothetical protein
MSSFVRRALRAAARTSPRIAPRTALRVARKLDPAGLSRLVLAYRVLLATPSVGPQGDGDNQERSS